MPLTADQRERMHESLMQYTAFNSTTVPDDIRREDVIDSIEACLALCDGSAQTRSCVYLPDSVINGCGEGTQDRDLLFEQLADIMCSEDVFEFQEKKEGEPEEIYQDAVYLEYRWRAYNTGRKFVFYTVSLPPEPGFKRTIMWHLLIVNWRLNERAKETHEAWVRAQIIENQLEFPMDDGCLPEEPGNAR